MGLRMAINARSLRAFNPYEIVFYLNDTTDRQPYAGYQAMRDDR
jgi:hypothetical protein